MNINRVVELLEDLKSEDQRRRVAAVKGLDKISEAMGTEKTRTQILPFLKEYEDDEEEVMVELAKQYVPLGKYINDNGTGVLDLIPYFYVILGYEDSSVIDEGLRSLEFLIKTYTICHEVILLLAKKLQTLLISKAQISASRICCKLSNAIPVKFSAEVSKIITDNANSKNNIVRRETATALRYLLDEASPYESLASGLIKKLLKDSQESVRVAALESMVYRKFPKPYFTSTFHQALIQNFDQKSWKIKWVIASNIGNILASIQPAHKKQMLLAYSKLIVDPEIEVSTRAVETLKELAGSFEPEEASLLLPILKSVMSTDNVDMKKVIARSLPSFAPHCTQPPNSDILKEMLNAILKDENAEVKSALMINSEQLNKAYNPQQLSSLFVGQLLELLNDKQWKVRKEAVKAVEILIIKLGEGFTSDEKILKAMKERLADKVYEVRVTMINSMKAMATHFGREWNERTLFPIIDTFSTNSNYLYRLSFVFAIKELIPILSNAFALKSADSLIKLAKDPVANVRVQAVITLVRLAKHLEDKTIEDRVISVMRELENDQDSDVQRVVGKMSGQTMKQVAARMVDQKLI